jgi:sigma54-dependent transcription regulator
LSARRRETDYLIQVKTLLGSALNTKDDSYLPYVGADWLDAETVASLQYAKRSPLLGLDKEDIALIDELLLLYEERRKAFFMTLGSDILTKISYLVGESHNVKRATDIHR